MVKTRSRFALNAANFFLADMTAVVAPFVGSYLHERGWSYAQTGAGVAAGGLGVLLLQTPAGLLADRTRRKRLLLALSTVVVGVGFALVPLAAHSRWLTDALLLVSGAASAVFVPVLASLAIALFGKAALAKVMGENQSANHAGNIAAALAALLLVSIRVEWVFYSIAGVSLIGAIAVLLIGPEADAPVSGKERAKVWGLFRDKRVGWLFAATALFHLANAPVMPLVALQIRALHGSQQQVALVVLIAQAVMIPVALLAGWGCGRFGRKPVFAVGFLALPARILLYALATTPKQLLAIQALDGVGAGIYGVAIALVCADLLAEAGAFNALMGVIATALALGGVLGPLVAGALVQRFGFAAAYAVFGAIATAAAAVFIVFVPETLRADDALAGGDPGGARQQAVQPGRKARIA